MKLVSSNYGDFAGRGKNAAKTSEWQKSYLYKCAIVYFDCSIPWATDKENIEESKNVFNFVRYLMWVQM